MEIGKFVIGTATLLLTSLSSFAQPIEIGSRRELFVDKLLIESMRDAELRLHNPVKAPRPKSSLPERHMLLTKPLVFAGNELQLNYSTSAAGSLRVELQQSDGKAIPGFRLEDCTPLYGDQIDQTVHWNGDKKLESLAGQNVRLRFVMQECDLYSFQFNSKFTTNPKGEK